MHNRSRLIGRTVPRREDLRFLTGTGRFLADLGLADGLQAAIVRSSVAAGRLVRVDVGVAAAMDGVAAVFTGADLAEELGPLPVLAEPELRFAEAASLQFNPPAAPCIATDEVRYVGEPVAVVVAADRYVAEDAAELVEVDYQPYEPVLDAASAMSSDVRAVHASNPDNVGVSLTIQRGRPGPPDAHHVVVEGRYHIGRHSGVPMECRGVAARPTRAGGVEVWTSTQVPHLVRRAISLATSWPPESVRVRAPDVGGGFGPKANVYGEDVLVPIIARRLGQAVTWVEDRYEHLISAAQSRDQTHHTRLVVDRDGRIVSFEDEFVVDVGAHNLWMLGVVANAAIHALGAYRIPVSRISGRAVFTNKTPTSQYRGAGRPEATFALERSLDAAARVLGISRFKLRELNLLDGSDLPYRVGMPYRDGVDIVYDGRDYAAVLEACLRLIPEHEVAAIREREEAAGRRVGVGVATFVEATGRGPHEQARARLSDDGSIIVEVGTASAGMGHETTLAQVAGDTLHRPLEAIQVRTADTAAVPESLGTFASRTAVVAGSAVREAAQLLREQLRDAVTRVRKVPPIDADADGLALEDGTVVAWRELAGWFSPGGELAGERLPEALAHFAPETVTWTMGAHAAVVSVDPGTGLVRVVRYASADEGGNLINPRVVEGQVKGGIAQGIGGALLEEFRYDDAGQPGSTTFAEYLLPATGDVPAIDVAHVEVPSDRNPLGLRGVGESGTIPGCAVIASAVEDALRELDVEVVATPIRPQHIRAWLRAAGR